MDRVAPRRGRGFVEHNDGVFQTDGLASWEYWERIRHNPFLEPEKKLMLAILVDAITCFRKYIVSRKRKERILFQEAEDWMLDPNGDEIFSFGQICQTMGVDASCLRRELMAWKLDRIRRNIRYPASGDIRRPNVARNRVQFFSLPGHGKG